MRVVDLSSEKADRFYKGLFGNRAEKGWTAAGAEVHAALTKKAAKYTPWSPGCRDRCCLTRLWPIASCGAFCRISGPLWKDRQKAAILS